MPSGYYPLNPGVCDPSTYWDPESEMCVYPQYTSCPDGYVDDGNGGCIPETQTNPATPTNTTVTAGNTAVTVNINNSVDNSQSGLNAIAAAVQQGITTSADGTANLVVDVNSDVQNEQDSIIQSIDTGVSSLLSNVQGFLSYIGTALINNIAPIITAISSNVGSAVSAIGNAVGSLLQQVGNAILTGIQDFESIYKQYVLPILTAINTTYQQIAALIIAVERDLHNGITGILQLPTDVANGLGSIEAGIDRAVTQLGLNTSQTASVYLSDGQGDTIWNRLQAIGKNLSAPQGASNVQTVFEPKRNLSDPNLVAALEELFSAISNNVGSVLSNIGGIGDSIANTLGAAADNTGGLVNVIVSAAVWVILVAESLRGQSGPLGEYLKAYTNSQAPLSKLDAGTALQAWLRGDITDAAATEELSFGGYDATRIQTLKDLQEQLLDVKTQLDMNVRGIISDDDLSQGLAQLGIYLTNQQALKAQFMRTVDVATASTAFKWGIIDQPTWASTLQVNRFTQDEITLARATLFQPEGTQDAINRLKRQQYYAELGFSPVNLGNVPPDVLTAAGVDGINAIQATNIWQQNFAVPALDQWINLYFRGLRTQNELFAAMDYYMIPEQLRQDYIAARRPLLQWRIIPSLIANGVLNTSQAAAYLQQHGYDLPTANLLIQYAQNVHVSAKAAASGDLQGLSVATAKSLWEQGTLSDTQYESVLVSHGYNADSAAMVVNTQALALHATERKQAGTDIVNEFLSGLITLDQAQAQMSAQNFTTAERAKVLKSIARIKKATSKTPSEAELTKMVQKSAIDFPTWQSAMSVLGYAQQWIDAFAVLNFGSADGPTAAAPTLQGTPGTALLPNAGIS